MQIQVFTDGSATTKDKPGGYAWVLVVDDKFHSEGYGHLEYSTNNDSELVAAIKGLEAVLKYIDSNRQMLCAAGADDPQIDRLTDCDVTLKSDSRLILGWSDGTYQFKQIDKIGLYEELRRLMRKLKAKTEWVKGHSGHPMNERCDELANMARLKLEKEKDKEEAKITGKSLIGKKKDGVVCVWYSGKLKVLDFLNNTIEDYDREEHGKRGSLLEIRGDKNR
jgi:ribonuclease HI